MHDQYHYLVGKQKIHVYYDLGLDFNFFPSTIWTYELHKNWFGITTTLMIFFKHDLV